MAEPSPDCQVICPHCRTAQMWVTFEIVAELWPRENVCGECHDKWLAEKEADRAFDLIHGGACGCRECC